MISLPSEELGSSKASEQSATDQQKPRASSRSLCSSVRVLHTSLPEHPKCSHGSRSRPRSTTLPEMSHLHLMQTCILTVHNALTLNGSLKAILPFGPLRVIPRRCSAVDTPQNGCRGMQSISQQHVGWLRTIYPLAINAFLHPPKGAMFLEGRGPSPERCYKQPLSDDNQMPRHREGFQPHEPYLSPLPTAFGPAAFVFSPHVAAFTSSKSKLCPPTRAWRKMYRDISTSSYQK